MNEVFMKNEQLPLLLKDYLFRTLLKLTLTVFAIQLFLRALV
jgi:hypothetical protein